MTIERTVFMGGFNSETEKKKDHHTLRRLIVAQVRQHGNALPYSDTFNPYTVGTLRFERFRRQFRRYTRQDWNDRKDGGE